MAADQDHVLETFLSFWVARGVMAAVEMDVFEILEGDGLSLEAAGARLGLASRPARALLDTCVAARLLTKSDGVYRNTEAASRYLHSASEHSVRNYVLDERWCWGAWGRLDEALRADAPTLPQDDDGYHTFPAEFFLDFLHGHSLRMGEQLATAVDFSGLTRVMDVGGGSGAVSIALCRANPSLHAVVVDRDEVLRAAAAHIARAGLSQRITTHPANVFSDPLPEDCDGAVIANMLHDFSPTKAREILARVAAALPSGARLVIMEMAPNDDRSDPPIAVAFALTMIVNTEGGDAYTVPEYRTWLEEAGFDVERVVPLGGRIVTTAIEARKR
ncbi:MAG: methyltransferase [Actinomycetota bacterium]